MSWIYSLIFRSQTDSYSYLPQFHFMNIILFCKYYNFMNIIPTHEYLSKLSWRYIILLFIIYIKYVNISIIFCLPGKIVKWKVKNLYQWQTIYIFFCIKIKKKRKEIFYVFLNSLQILVVWQIIFLFLFASFEICKPFLFLFVQKLACQIYSYSYSQKKKKIFAEHWKGGHGQP